MFLRADAGSTHRNKTNAPVVKSASLVHVGSFKFILSRLLFFSRNNGQATFSSDAVITNVIYIIF